MASSSSSVLGMLLADFLFLGVLADLIRLVFFAFLVLGFAAVFFGAGFFTGIFLGSCAGCGLPAGSASPDFAGLLRAGFLAVILTVDDAFLAVGFLAGAGRVAGCFSGSPDAAAVFSGGPPCLTWPCRPLGPWRPWCRRGVLRTQDAAHLRPSRGRGLRFRRGGRLA